MNCAILQLCFHLQSARFRRQADDVGTGVNGLLIGQREPKEVKPTNPFPNPAQGRKGPSWTLARPARNTYGGPQVDWPIKCNQGILPAKAPQEL